MTLVTVRPKKITYFNPNGRTKTMKWVVFCKDIDFKNCKRCTRAVAVVLPNCPNHTRKQRGFPVNYASESV